MQYTLKEWQLLYEACPIQTRHSVKDGDFLCTRIENTHFSIARTFGSVSVAGRVFRYAVAKPGDGLDGGDAAEGGLDALARLHPRQQVAAWASRVFVRLSEVRRMPAFGRG